MIVGGGTYINSVREISIRTNNSFATEVKIDGGNIAAKDITISGTGKFNKPLSFPFLKGDAVDKCNAYKKEYLKMTEKCEGSVSGAAACISKGILLTSPVNNNCNIASASTYV